MAMTSADMYLNNQTQIDPDSTEYGNVTYVVQDLVGWLFKLNYRVIIPAICMPGMFLTAVSITVFIQKITHHRRIDSRSNVSLDILLLAMSVFDCALLTSTLLVFPVTSLCVAPKNGSLCALLNRQVLVSYPMALFCQFCSVWMCVAVALDRFVAVYFPLQRLNWGSSTRARTLIMLIVIGGLVYRFPVYFSLRFDESINQARQVPYTHEHWYRFTYSKVCSLIFMFAIPWSLIIVLNAAVLAKIKMAGWNTDDRRRTTLRRGENRRIATAMLVALTFLIFNMPIHMTNVLEQGTFTHTVCHLLSTAAVCFNSATNWIIYCSTGDAFRQKFRKNIAYLVTVGRVSATGYNMSNLEMSMVGGMINEQNYAANQRSSRSVLRGPSSAMNEYNSSGCTTSVTQNNQKYSSELPVTQKSSTQHLLSADICHSPPVRRTKSHNIKAKELLSPLRGNSNINNEQSIKVEPNQRKHGNQDYRQLQMKNCKKSSLSGPVIKVQRSEDSDVIDSLTYHF